eukprot:184446_1
MAHCAKSTNCCLVYATLYEYIPSVQFKNFIHPIVFDDPSENCCMDSAVKFNVSTVEQSTDAAYLDEIVIINTNDIYIMLAIDNKINPCFYEFMNL